MVIKCKNLHCLLDKYNSQFGGMVNQYAYYHEEDDTTFQLVDSARIQKPIYQRGRIKFNQVYSIPDGLTKGQLKNNNSIQCKKYRVNY